MSYTAMTRFHFWQQWLFWTSILFALFGVVFALWGANPAFEKYNDQLALLLLHRPALPPEVDLFRKFVWAPLGGTIAAVYIMTAWLAAVPFRRRETWARAAIITSFGCWIVIDSSACLYYHVYFQAWLINGFSFTVKALPLIFTWNDFKRPVSSPL